jgi:hypothetical protein
MTPAREQSLWLRAALHAYPERWRATRQAELLGVLADSVPDRPHWPGTKALADLVVGGWRIRWQLHPPFWRWVGYRFGDIRLPATWREWVRSDINGRWWWLRRSSLAVLLLLFLAASPGVFAGSDFRVVLGVVGAGGLLSSRPLIERQRSAALRRHVPDRTQVLWVPARTWVPAPARARATPFLLATGALLTMGAPAAAWALLYPNNGPVSQTLSFGTDQEDLAHVFAWTWTVVGAGAILAVLFLTLGYSRIPGRLATRTTGIAGMTPTYQLPRSRLVTVAAAQLAVEILICVGQLAGVIPGMFALTLAGGGLCAGPLLVALGYAARTSERASGIDVTFHDCQLAVCGHDATIPPEIGKWITATQPVPIEGPQLP